MGPSFWEEESAYHRYVGQDSCRYLKPHFVVAIYDVAKQLHIDFPDRPDRRLWVGDNTPLYGSCDNHPTASHDKRNSLDINYYTLVGFNGDFNGNGTHYVKRGERLTPLFSLQDFDEPRVDRNVFDWERTLRFMELLLDKVPRVYYRINTDLWEFIKKRASKDTINKLLYHVSPDRIVVHQHDKHMHIDLESLMIK